jgi:hypothetical protein
MADVLGISRATVTVYDRVLAENGLRSKSGRGTSAARVTSQDAANLLIALAASPIFGLSAKDAVRNCEAYGSLRRAEVGWPEAFTEFGLPTLARLPPKQNFRAALSALIDAAGRGETFKLPERGKRFSLSTYFEVRFIGPGPCAEIIVDGTKEFGLMGRLIYIDPRQAKRFRLKVSKDGRPKIADLRHTSSVGFTTIQILGSLVSRDSKQNDR